MPRLSLTGIIPVIILVGGFLLFIHKWTEHTPESGGAAAVAAAGLPSGPQAGAGLLPGSGSNAPPAAATSQAGTPTPPSPGNAATSATPQAPARREPTGPAQTH